MDAGAFERLLFAGESEVLDFKSQQYKFEGGSDDEKSELLKDILAFANAWRKTEAHILIGVQEVQGSKSTICGVATHLLDNNLQQFVNSKTQQPIIFSYEAISVDGKQVGVVSIPLQKRPFFIKKKYGTVEADKVYLRRGSCTAIATPDEIFEMGRQTIETPVATLEIKTAINIRKSQFIISEIWLDSWLINRSLATAYDVQIKFENEPNGRHEFNHMVWEDRLSSGRIRAQALLHALHPGDEYPMVSWSMGHAGTHDEIMRENTGEQFMYGVPLNYCRGDVATKVKVMARDLAPIEISIEYSTDEIRNMLTKTFLRRNG